MNTDLFNLSRAKTPSSFAKVCAVHDQSEWFDPTAREFTDFKASCHAPNARKAKPIARDFLSFDPGDLKQLGVIKDEAFLFDQVFEVKHAIAV